MNFRIDYFLFILDGILVFCVLEAKIKPIQKKHADFMQIIAFADFDTIHLASAIVFIFLFQTL